MVGGAGEGGDGLGAVVEDGIGVDFAAGEDGCKRQSQERVAARVCEMAASEQLRVYDP